MGDACVVQIIDAKGVLDVSELENFMKKLKLDDGPPYVVVSTIGAQSSGKSTLLNHLFGTKFMMMDSTKRRTQTTQGIWLAKAETIETCTLVMDIEGTDGRERGEDDLTFEKQSALFALAVSDTVLINMWFHDIGREQAGNRPLLKNVFLVMMRMKNFNLRKKTILFVVRDVSMTTVLENINSDLMEDIQKIWDGIPKPDAHRDTLLSDIFNVEIKALPSYEDMKQSFEKEVSSLRYWFQYHEWSQDSCIERASLLMEGVKLLWIMIKWLLKALAMKMKQYIREAESPPLSTPKSVPAQHSIAPAGPSGNRHGLIPVSGFSLMVQQIWKEIKENKDLNLPTNKVMVATMRCGQISSENLASFTSDKEWQHFKEGIQNDYLTGFGKTISRLLNRYLSKYDEDSYYFDEDIRTSKRHQLESKILQHVNPAYQSLMGHLLTRTLKAFKESVDEDLKYKGFAVAARDCTQPILDKFDRVSEDATIPEVKWDAEKFKDVLKRGISEHVESIHTAKLRRALQEPVMSLLVSAGDNTWSDIRNLLQHETKAAVADFQTALSGLKLNEGTESELVLRLENHGRSVVESKAREEATRVSSRMKDRFSLLFNLDADRMPRVWTGKEDIQAIARTVRLECAKMLFVMAVLRLDGDAEYIEKFLPLLVEWPGKTDKSNQYFSLASILWEKMPKEKTLISAVQCKSLWRQFNVETEYIVAPVIAAQEARRWNERKTLILNILTITRKIVGVLAVIVGLPGFN